ncbi:hypothetical protein U9M48_021769 [Paspalum notatum var. saurae]|uniref:Uncharacterized protein n=1 Tax=Paspalum notatum var. saurae TaxID=547442 RepID=A0AAQ3WTZ7_PASNO
MRRAIQVEPSRIGVVAPTEEKTPGRRAALAPPGYPTALYGDPRLDVDDDVGSKACCRSKCNAPPIRVSDTEAASQIPRSRHATRTADAWPGLVRSCLAACWLGWSTRP